MRSRPPDFVAPTLKGPNQEQLAALQRYADANGRTWKNELSLAWYSGADEREEDAGYEKARPLVHQPATANGEVGERLFALLELALCGVMTEEQQADLIRQARNRGLLPAAG